MGGVLEKSETPFALVSCRGVQVIAHLQSVLDFERGADAAKRFNSFYEVTRGMILSVNVDASRNTLQRLIEMYSSMRQAWQQAESRITK